MRVTDSGDAVTVRLYVDFFLIARYCGHPQSSENQTLTISTYHFPGPATYQCISGHQRPNVTQHRSDSACTATGVWESVPEPCARTYLEDDEQGAEDHPWEMVL